jgi:hypothetical protein
MNSILSVVTAAESQDLTLVETVRNELGLSTENDQFIERLVHEASAACASYCDRVFGEEVVSEVIRNTVSRDSIHLQRWPVSSVSSVVEDGVTLDADEYEVDPVTGFLYRLDGDDGRSCWPCVKITVTYTGGYELLDELPRDIERACIELVKAWYFSAKRDPMVKSSDLPGVMSESYWVGGIGNGALPPNVTALLDQYRSFTF